MDILQAASTLSQWCTDEIHRLELTNFSVAVIEDLNSCFESCSILTTKKEKMWSNFHRVRMSPSYHKKWITFLNASVGSYPPVFYQYLTDTTFNLLIEHNFPLPSDSLAPGTHNISGPSVFSFEVLNANVYQTTPAQEVHKQCPSNTAVLSFTTVVLWGSLNGL